MRKLWIFISITTLCIGSIASFIMLPSLMSGHPHKNPEATLMINEVMSRNKKTLFDKDGDSVDWIEIYNYGDKDIALKGFGLSDKEDDQYKWVFPDLTIKSKDYLLLYASSKAMLRDGEIHINFNLNKTGETLLLSDPDESIVDQVYILQSPEDISMGKLNQNDDALQFLTIPTPGDMNVKETIYPAYKASPLHPPSFSFESGFYQESFDLTLSTQEDAQIYYTLDGSTPTTNSFLYDQPINIESRVNEPNNLSDIQHVSYEISDTNPLYKPQGKVFKATVVRARAFKNSYPYSPVITKTYFVDKDIQSRYKLPILSIVTNSHHLFDKKSGIYTTGTIFEEYKKKYPDTPINGGTPANYNQRGKAWEKEISFEWFEDGQLAYENQTGLRIFGGWSRTHPQKSLKIYARDIYSHKDNLPYPFFPDLKNRYADPIMSYKTFLLRASGNDWNETFIRDGLMHELVKGTSLDHQAFRQIILFINGEFWGLYNLRESIDAHYLENHYGIPEEESVILENFTELSHGNAGDEKHFNDLLAFVGSHDLSKNENYEMVQKQMDTTNYIEYVVAEIYYGNTDWPGNNLKLWRKKTDYNSQAPYGHDGRWRFILFDTDTGFNMYPDFLGGIENDTLAMATEEDSGVDWPNPPYSTLLLHQLLQNQQFAHEFINTMCDWLNTRFQPDYIKDAIDKKVAPIDGMMMEHLNRWNSIVGGYDGWKKELDTLYSFSPERNTHVKSSLEKYFHLQGPCRLTLDFNPKEVSLHLNSLTNIGVDDGVWQGDYYRGVPIELEATPLTDLTFDKWVINGIEYTSNPIQITPEEESLTVTCFLK